MADAQREGTMSWNMGKVDPEVEGYNGKDWGNRMGFVDGDPFAREQTHGTGNVTTQTERGYTVKQQPWNMIDEGADIGVPNQQGTLATGGTLNVATEGMDPQKLMLMGSMLGITNGPKGTTMGPNGTYGDGKFQASDVINWAQQHPWLWKIGKTLGNLVIPGAATIGDAALRYGVSHGVGDGVPGNASIRRVYK